LRSRPQTGLIVTQALLSEVATVCTAFFLFASL